MNYLEKKVQEKKHEVAQKREKVSLNTLTNSKYFKRETYSFSKAIQNGTGIIGEFKRASPSAGPFNQSGRLLDTIKFYQANNVSAYSILTDFKDFGGSIEDILTVRDSVGIPILRKDFIVDEYQVIEAKAFGADAILLIAAALDEYHCENLSLIAKSIGLEVLMEFHFKEELECLNENVDVVGINNRNLKTLQTEVKTSLDLIKYLPYNNVKISESGIKTLDQIELLLEAGYDGFLIGEFLLKSQENVDFNAINKLITTLKSVRT